jgi:hypothetical protein
LKNASGGGLNVRGVPREAVIFLSPPRGGRQSGRTGAKIGRCPAGGRRRRGRRGPPGRAPRRATTGTTWPFRPVRGVLDVLEAGGRHQWRSLRSSATST